VSLVSSISAQRLAYETPKRCKLGILISYLNTEDKEAMEYAIRMVREQADLPQSERMFTIAWLTGVLNDNKHPIGKTVVSEHVRKVCACEQASQ
jgi:hypothetical protein